MNQGGRRVALLLLLVSAGRSTGGATGRSRGRLEAVADGEGAAYEFGLLIEVEEGGRRGSCDRRGRTPELQQWGGAWRRGGAMEEDEDPRRQEFQIEGSLVLFPVFTWSEKFPNDNYFGTEGVYIIPAASTFTNECLQWISLFCFSMYILILDLKFLGDVVTFLVNILIFFQYFFLVSMLID